MGAEQIEADLHFFLNAAAALFRCAEAASRRLDLTLPTEPANLRAARNISQHIEDYNVGTGWNRSIWRQQVQVWQLRNESGRAIWTWAGIELDIDSIGAQAAELARHLVEEITRRVPPDQRGQYLVIGEHRGDRLV